MKIILGDLDISSSQKLESGLEDFWIMAKAYIGPANESGNLRYNGGYPYYEQFIFYFTTQKFLDRIHEGGYTLGRGEYIIDKYTGEEDLRKFIEKIIDKCSKNAKDWKDFANKLNEYSYWEYDHYIDKK